MPHHTPLIATIVASLGLAFVFGGIAQKLRMPPLVGYLLAGVVIGPFTPGYVADQALALELAELGVILLMFGVGLHFSLDDLLSVKAIAIPGAVVQIGIATLLGMGLAALMDWPVAQGFVFGLALSVASTVVLLRALEERRLVETERGRIAVGWLIVEDLAMVLTLVLLPAVAGMLGGTAPGNGGAQDLQGLLWTLGGTLLRVAAFIALMLVVGRRVIPWLLHYVAHTGSRELFSLSVLAVALGIAFGSAALFGVSFALGAFFAGMVLGGSTLTQRAAEETLPLRDAFAVLFFVSVGMLFDPAILLREPWAVLATFLIIVVGKSVAAFLIVLAFRRPVGTALMISVSLAQIGEFSFILAGLGIDLGLLTKEGRDLLLAGAILSILTNPLLFAWLDRLERRRPTESVPAGGAPAPARAELPVTDLVDHAVVVGWGRVGRLVVEDLSTAGVPVVLVEDRNEGALSLRQPPAADGAPAGTSTDTAPVDVILDNAAEARVLEAANLVRARWLFIAIPDGFEGGRIVARARELNPTMRIIARAHSEEADADLRRHGATTVVVGERQIARAMVAHALDDLRPRAGDRPRGETRPVADLSGPGVARPG